MMIQKLVCVNYMPNKPKTKEDKITFIMSYRHDEIKNNDTFFKHLFKEYSKMDNDELDIEFNYYFNIDKKI